MSAIDDLQSIPPRPVLRERVGVRASTNKVSAPIFTWLVNVQRFILGAVLIIAAFAKALALRDPSPPQGFFNKPPFLIAAIIIELLLGIFLLAGYQRRLTHIAALICFGLFTMREFYVLFTGSPSCGCFGSIPVNPRYTLAFDLSAWIGLLFSFPSPGNPREGKGEGTRRWVRLAMPTSLIACLATATLMFTQQLSAHAQNTSHDAIVLNPDSWISKPLPILNDINPGIPGLSQGRWIVILYRADCPHCMAVLDHYIQTAGRHPEKLAFIQIPHLGNVEPEQTGLPANIFQGKLDLNYKWIVATPVQMEIDNGVVIRLITDMQN